MPVQELEDLGEIRLGAWEGLSFEQLARQEGWKQFNTFRSGTRPPGGELMVETQVRMVRRMECLRARHPGETVALVSHADPLRAAVAWVLGTPLDMMFRFEIAPASVSTIRMNEWGAQVMGLNDTGESPA